MKRLLNILSDFKKYVKGNPKGSPMAIWNRTNIYLNVPSRLAMIAVFYKVYSDQISLFWFLLICFALICFIVIVVIYDVARVQPDHADYNLVRSKTFRQISRDVAYIRTKLK